MRIACIGGGPAGLYFAILMKKADPAHDIVVLERNRSDDTFGFGVVFSDETLDTFEKYDRASYQAITENFAYWDDIEIHFRNKVHRVGGNGFCGCARTTLLRLLYERARSLGVKLQFQTEIDSNLSALAGADLIVHSAHGWGYEGSKAARLLFHWVQRLTGLVTDGLTGDSAATIRDWQKEGIVGRALARVVHCGIDISQFSGSSRDTVKLRDELQIPATHRIVLNLSCLKPQKDPLAYVRLAARVIESYREVTFVLAGDARS